MPGRPRHDPASHSATGAGPLSGPAYVHVVLAVAGASAIVLVARRARALSRSGAIAAWGVGVVTARAGWDWAALLIAFFVAGSALSRFGRARKSARLEGMLEKGDARDAMQVLANGGVFALAAAAHLAAPSTATLAVGAGALAAAAADTFATELGTLSARPPRSILSGRRVPAGTSGGVTLHGNLAMFAGAAFLAAVALLVRWPPVVAGGAFVGGVAGAIADSLLGAVVQERRWCPHCDEPTERRRHRCGHATRVCGGVRGVGNDLVNVGCTLVGALLAWWLAV